MSPSAIHDTNSTNGLSERSAKYVKQWQDNVRGGFAAFPVVIESAENYTLTDVDGKKYIDLISQFAVMNFGYSPPKIVTAAVDQMQKSPLVNTGYINPLYAQFAERITKVRCCYSSTVGFSVEHAQKFGFDSITTMLSGSEAVESAVKISRKWAYLKKGIPADQAWVLTADRCYHGITLATMPLSNNIAERKILYPWSS